MTYTRGFSDSYRFTQYCTRKITGLPLSVILDNATVTTLTGSRTGVSMPGWRSVIRNGGNASTPYTSDRSTVLASSYGEASATGTHLPASPSLPASTRTDRYSGVIRPNVGPISHLSGNTNQAEAVALTQLYRKIESEISRLNGSAVLAEFGDVLRMFGHPFKSLVRLTERRINLLAKARKGLNGTPSQKRDRYGKIVSDTYLEYAFGMVPLISDTKAAAEAFARFNYEKTGNQPRRTKVSGRGETSTAVSTPSVAVVPGSMIVYNQTVKQRTNFRCQYVCGLSSSHIADFGSNERLLQLLGFQPLSWIPAVWEVVPYSFLVDYFTNVGDILQASVTNTSGVTWICKTVLTETTMSWTSIVDSGLTKARAEAFGYEAGGGGGGSCGSTVSVRKTMVRTVPAQLTLPSLTVSVPTDAQKYVNMAALLVSKLRF